MKLELVKCPCCGNAMTSNAVTVSTAENRIYYKGQTIKLPSRLIDLAFVLARRMPTTVERGQIISEMWGDSEPAFADASLKVACNQLRKHLKPLGLAIITTWGIGLRMVILSKET